MIGNQSFRYAINLYAWKLLIGTFIVVSSCFCFLMSKDLSGVAERLSAKYGAIGASVFRHEKQVGNQHKDPYTVREISVENIPHMKNTDTLLLAGGNL